MIRNPSISFLVAGSMENGIVDESIRLINSILLHSSCPIHFHIVTGHGSATPLQHHFSLLQFHGVHNFNHFTKDLDIDWVEESLHDLELEHHSGPYGYSKLLLDKIWPELDHGLFLDTDMIVTADPCPYFKSLLKEMRKDKRGLAMAYQFDNVKSKVSHMKYKCSGTLFFNFKDIRQSNLMDDGIRFAYNKRYPDGLPSKELIGRKAHFVTRGDQDYFWMLTLEFPKQTWPISMSWSLEFCHKFHGYRIPTLLNSTSTLDSFGDPLFMGALHLNCLGFTDRPAIESSFPEFKQVIDFYSNLNPFLVSQIKRISA
ncbi:hypothetical protein GEMRC1_004232 [Eukaryota sp. GEM-RC1]